MTRPKVSVLMSVYDGERYLRQSVESILNQTLSDLEFIIVDDASEDGTWEILTAYAGRDSRIVLVHNKENIGLTRSLNKGLALACGEYVARHDADDVSFHDRLEKQVDWIDHHPEVVLVSSNVRFIDSEGRYLGQSRRTGDPDLVAWYLLFYNYVAGHSVVMFRRKPVLDLGGYSESYHYSQDHELWLRLVEVGDIVILPDILLQWRRHGGNISVKAHQDQEWYSLNATKHGISRLIGEELSLAEIEELRHFWSGGFMDSKKLGAVQIRLRQIYGEFLKQRSRQGRSHPELSRRIPKLISKQFFQCSQILNARRRLPLYLRGSVYALTWHPMVVVTYWLSEICKKPVRLLRALARTVS